MGLAELFSDRRTRNSCESAMTHDLVLNLQESVDSFVSACGTNSFPSLPLPLILCPKECGVSAYFQSCAGYSSGFLPFVDTWS